jgi:DNA repair protein RecO (recombination protein O)
MHHTTRAIILKKVVYGEADLIVTFFGREEGRLTGIAKHARASQRRFGGALELGSIVDLRYVARSASNMVRIEDAHIHMPTVGVMQSLDRIRAMSRALELALAFIPERQAVPEKFDLMEEYIASISEREPDADSRISFELKWLALVGYQPALDHCMSCGGDGKKAWSFSMDHGGVFCKDCAGPNLRKIDLKDRTLQGMRLLSNGGRAVLDESDRRAITSLLANYVQHLIGRPLPAGTIFERF